MHLEPTHALAYVTAFSFLTSTVRGRARRTAPPSGSKPPLHRRPWGRQAAERRREAAPRGIGAGWQHRPAQLKTRSLRIKDWTGHARCVHHSVRCNWMRGEEAAKWTAGQRLATPETRCAEWENVRRGTSPSPLRQCEPDTTQGSRADSAGFVQPHGPLVGLPEGRAGVAVRERHLLPRALEVPRPEFLDI